jgi:hypothetical protein
MDVLRSNPEGDDRVAFRLASATCGRPFRCGSVLLGPVRVSRGLSDVAHRSIELLTCRSVYEQQEAETEDGEQA